MIRSSESEETLMMCGRDFESRPDGAYTEELEQISYYGKENKMSFIKIQYNDDVSFINPAAVTGVSPMLCGTRVCCGSTTYLSGDTPEHLIQMIEDARNPKPVQNVYYRMADRKPTEKECDDGYEVLVSDDGDTWYLRDIGAVENYLFWAPMPKVEVKA